MDIKSDEQLLIGQPIAADRIGFAKLMKMRFDGVDLRPLQQGLIEQIANGAGDAGMGMDLSLIAQLLGEKQTGLKVQTEMLVFHQLYRSPCLVDHPKFRVLALAADIDIGGNTPIEFLLENSDIELTTLYVVSGVDLAQALPEHDIAIVVASDSEECREMLRKIDRVAARWPRPLLNPPSLICNLDRDKLYRLLSGIDGVDIPATVCVTRAQLAGEKHPANLLPDVMGGHPGPVIIRPRGSHAGVGLAKIDDAAAMAQYLDGQAEQEFFISRFVDYSNDDGQFRKYRIVAVAGRFYACHMAIADQWDIWYYNAGMMLNESKREEEAAFMRGFDTGFAVRHQQALASMAERIGLDYFTVDCAENKKGELLIFEADNTAVVHNMDSPELFPYKPPQMRAIFSAFANLLYERAENHRTRVA